MQPKKISKLAIWAFVLAMTMPFLYIINGTGAFKSIGFFFLVILPPFLTLLFSITALVQIKKSQGIFIGNFFAIAALMVLSLWVCIIILKPRAKVRSPRLMQISKFNSIHVALELFNSEFKTLPPSNRLDPTDTPYCGAMKLAEALMGQDLMGFWKDSVFRSDGMNSEGTIELYPKKSDIYDFNFRRGPYLPIEKANAHCLKEIFENTAPFDGNKYVICDIFTKKRHSGKKIGMPVLYYKADTSKNSHDVNNPDNPDNIYNYKDNYDLLALGVPGQPDKKHPLFEDPTIFYKMTKDYKSRKVSIPNRIDSFILISAGPDCLYGTKDDCVNFDMGWKPK